MVKIKEEKLKELVKIEPLLLEYPDMETKFLCYITS